MDTLHCASMYFVDCVVLPSIRILASFRSILDELRQPGSKQLIVL